MAKILVETKGSFEFLVPGTNDYIRFAGPTVVTTNAFIETKLAKGELVWIDRLKDEATDAELLKYIAASDGDFALASASFLSKYGEDAEPVDDVVVEKPKASTRRRKVN